MTSKKDKSIDALRQILLHDDLTRLKKLESDILHLKDQIADKESLIASLDPVIADLLERKIAVSRDEMAQALAPIMGEAIRRQVAEAKEDVIDALYPVIGKVIRKSVAEAMKKFIESVNQKIDQTLRSRLFKKRVQSKLTGVSEAELILKDALPFKIEEIFLIHKDSGVLIAHVSSKETEVTVDQELISGMLTAIRDFVAEAFKTDKDQDLEEIQYGDSKILLEMGHHSYLALVVSGFEPADFQDDVRNLARRIHNRYYKFLRQFNGEMTKSGEITKNLMKFYEKYQARKLTKATVKSRPYLLYLLIFVLLILIAIFAVRKIPDFLAQQQLQHSIEARFESVPELSHQNIKCRVSNGWLTVTGNVPTIKHIKLVDSVSHQIEGIKGFNNRLIVSDENTFAAAITQQINQKLQESSHLRDLEPRFITEDDQVIIEGNVPNLATKREIGFIVSEIAGVRWVINNLVVQKDSTLSLEEIRKILKQHTVYFNVNDAIIPEDEARKLDAVLHLVQNLSDMKLIIKGYSDISSTPDYNLRLSEQRAKIVAEELVAKNFPSSRIIIQYFGDNNPIASNDTEEGRAKNRRVEFDVVKER